jgi:hypothetical protein
MPYSRKAALLSMALTIQLRLSISVFWVFSTCVYMFEHS